MGIENDLIKREINRLTLLLSRLIEKTIGLNSNNASEELDKIDKTLKDEFDLSVNDIIYFNDLELKQKISCMHETHLELLSEFIFELIMNDKLNGANNRIDNLMLKKKLMVILDYLNKSSETYSFKRMQMKDKLNALL
ncbi:hypothetical protein [Aestuariibaculum sediminum]|uniref:Uncharacterized protein n=1 Tax=Aestuariibaculum sediminum TaxID=2770637 RepID=A0A8J6PZZ6_9FLAO|nr:hypothetical protein [Aestuariibaculum sediminum]MBD0831997.1 hypothetical protein [Aestuariibaculum sediminum]